MHSLLHHIQSLRAVKSPSEIRLLKKAGEIAVNALKEVNLQTETLEKLASYDNDCHPFLRPFPSLDPVCMNINLSLSSSTAAYPKGPRDFRLFLLLPGQTGAATSTTRQTDNGWSRTHPQQLIYILFKWYVYPFCFVATVN